MDEQTIADIIGGDIEEIDVKPMTLEDALGVFGV